MGHSEGEHFTPGASTSRRREPGPGTLSHRLLHDRHGPERTSRDNECTEDSVQAGKTALQRVLQGIRVLPRPASVSSSRTSTRRWHHCHSMSGSQNNIAVLKPLSQHCFSCFNTAV